MVASETWKVGELAKQTGLTVRTLHYYDQIGLLSPSQRTDVGHRRYVPADIARLQQIQSLRQIGFSLDEIRSCLDTPGYHLRDVIGLHVRRLREQIDLQSRLCRRLEAMETRLGSAEEVSAEEFIQTMEVMSMFEKYYTPEQLEELSERRRTVGEERIREVEAEWPMLIEQVRAALNSRADPASEPVQRLAARWMGLVKEFTGGNPGIEKSLGTMYEQEPSMTSNWPDGKEMFEYISRAVAAGKG